MDNLSHRKGVATVLVGAPLPPSVVTSAVSSSQQALKSNKCSAISRRSSSSLSSSNSVSLPSPSTAPGVAINGSSRPVDHDDKNHNTANGHQVPWGSEQCRREQVESESTINVLGRSDSGDEQPDEITHEESSAIETLGIPVTGCFSSASHASTTIETGACSSLCAFYSASERISSDSGFVSVEPIVTAEGSTEQSEQQSREITKGPASSHSNSSSLLNTGGGGMPGGPSDRAIDAPFNDEAFSESRPDGEEDPQDRGASDHSSRLVDQETNGPTTGSTTVGTTQQESPSHSHSSLIFGNPAGPLSSQCLSNLCTTTKTQKNSLEASGGWMEANFGTPLPDSRDQKFSNSNDCADDRVGEGACDSRTDKSVPTPLASPRPSVRTPALQEISEGSVDLQNSQRAALVEGTPPVTALLSPSIPSQPVPPQPSTPASLPLSSNHRQHSVDPAIDNRATAGADVRPPSPSPRSPTVGHETHQESLFGLPLAATAQSDANQAEGPQPATSGRRRLRRDDDLPSPFSRAAVARMQRLKMKRGKQIVTVRANCPDLLAGTLGQLSALGLRRSSSVCSEPSLNTSQKRRYELLLMQHTSNKFEKKCGVGREHRQHKALSSAVPCGNGQIRQLIGRSKAQGNSTDDSMANSSSAEGVQSLSSSSIKSISINRPPQTNNCGDAIMARIPSSSILSSAQMLNLPPMMRSSSPLLGTANRLLPPHSNRQIPRSQSYDSSKPDLSSQPRRDLSCDTSQNSTEVAKRWQFPSPLALYLFQCDCMLKALLYHVTPTPKEKEAKRQTFNALSHFLNAWKGNKIQIYVAGSTAYDVDSTTSDLDIVITTQGEENHLKVLRDLCEKIQYTKDCCAADPSIKWPLQSVEMQVVQNARVPILLLKVEPQIVCDISVNAENSLCHTEFFKAILRDREHLRSFMRIIKHWVRVRRLPAMRDGGLPRIWLAKNMKAEEATAMQSQGETSPRILRTSASDIGSTTVNPVLNRSLLSSQVVRDTSKAEIPKPPTTVRPPPPPSDDNGSFPFSSLSSSSSTAPQSPGTATLKHFTSEYTDWLWSLNFSAAQIPITAPLTTLLGEFFAHLRSRKLLTCTMSIAAGLIIPKNMKDVTAKILSIPSHGGVWDEMLSVEDPAAFDKDFFPNALLIDQALMLGRKLEAPNVGENGIPLHYFKDLSSKISSATWLVYLYELRRGYQVIKNSIYGSGASNLDKKGEKKDEAKMIEGHTDRLVEMFAALFQENPESRYWIPATLPAKLPVVAPARHNGNLKDQEGEEKTPRVAVAESCVSDFFIVLLDGKLMIMKFVKICADREGWWSSDFLSRRDVRSHIHGRPFYCVSIPDAQSGTDLQLLPSNDSAARRRWLICNSMLMANIRFNAAESEASLLDWDDLNSLPDSFRPGGTSVYVTDSPRTKELSQPGQQVTTDSDGSSTSEFIGPADHVVFLPCNIVCQLRAKRITTGCSSSEVYELPDEEVQLVKSMLELVRESPFWYAKQPASHSITSYGAQLQPAAPDCKICHQRGITDFSNDLGLPHRPYDWLDRILSQEGEASFSTAASEPHPPASATQHTESEIRDALDTFLGLRFGEDVKKAVLEIASPVASGSSPKGTVASSLVLRAKHEFKTNLPPLVLHHVLGEDNPHVNISGLPLARGAAECPNPHLDLVNDRCSSGDPMKRSPRVEPLRPTPRMASAGSQSSNNDQLLLMTPFVVPYGASNCNLRQMPPMPPQDRQWSNSRTTSQSGDFPRRHSVSNDFRHPAKNGAQASVPMSDSTGAHQPQPPIQATFLGGRPGGVNPGYEHTQRAVPLVSYHNAPAGVVPPHLNSRHYPNATPYNQHVPMTHMRTTELRSPVLNHVPPSHGSLRQLQQSTPHHPVPFKIPQFLMTQFPYAESHPPSSVLGDTPSHSVPHPVGVAQPRSPGLSTSSTEVVFVAKGQPYHHSSGVCCVFASVVGLALTVHQVMPTNNSMSHPRPHPVPRSAESLPSNSSVVAFSPTLHESIPPTHSNHHHEESSSCSTNALSAVPSVSSPEYQTQVTAGMSPTAFNLPPHSSRFRAPSGWTQVASPYVGTSGVVPYAYLASLLNGNFSQQQQATTLLNTMMQSNDAPQHHYPPPHPPLHQQQHYAVIPPQQQEQQQRPPMHHQAVEPGMMMLNGGYDEADKRHQMMPTVVGGIADEAMSDVSMSAETCLGQRRNRPGTTTMRSVSQQQHGTNERFREPRFNKAVNQPLKVVRYDSAGSTRNEGKQMDSVDTNGPEDKAEGALQQGCGTSSTTAASPIDSSLVLTEPLSETLVSNMLDQRGTSTAQAASPVSSSGSAVSSLSGARVPNKRRGDIPRYIPPGQRGSLSNIASMDIANSLECSPTISRLETGGSTFNDNKPNVDTSRTSTSENKEDDGPEQQQTGQQQQSQSGGDRCRPCREDFDGHYDDNGDEGGGTGCHARGGRGGRSPSHLPRTSTDDKTPQYGSSNNEGYGQYRNGAITTPLLAAQATTSITEKRSLGYVGRVGDERPVGIDNSISARFNSAGQFLLSSGTTERDRVAELTTMKSTLVVSSPPPHHPAVVVVGVPSSNPSNQNLSDLSVDKVSVGSQWNSMLEEFVTVDDPSARRDGHQLASTSLQQIGLSSRERVSGSESTRSDPPYPLPDSNGYQQQFNRRGDLWSRRCHSIRHRYNKHQQRRPDLDFLSHSHDFSIHRSNTFSEPFKLSSTMGCECLSSDAPHDSLGPPPLISFNSLRSPPQSDGSSNNNHPFGWPFTRNRRCNSVADGDGYELCQQQTCPRTTSNCHSFVQQDQHPQTPRGDSRGRPVNHSHDDETPLARRSNGESLAKRMTEHHAAIMNNRTAGSASSNLGDSSSSSTSWLHSRGASNQRSDAWPSIDESSALVRDPQHHQGLPENPQRVTRRLAPRAAPNSHPNSHPQWRPSVDERRNSNAMNDGSASSRGEESRQSHSYGNNSNHHYYDSCNNNQNYGSNSRRQDWRPYHNNNGPVNHYQNDQQRHEECTTNRNSGWHDNDTSRCSSSLMVSSNYHQVGGPGSLSSGCRDVRGNDDCKQQLHCEQLQQGEGCETNSSYSSYEHPRDMRQHQNRRPQRPPWIGQQKFRRFGGPYFHSNQPRVEQRDAQQRTFRRTSDLYNDYRNHCGQNSQLDNSGLKRTLTSESTEDTTATGSCDTSITCDHSGSLDMELQQMTAQRQRVHASPPIDQQSSKGALRIWQVALNRLNKSCST